MIANNITIKTIMNIDYEIKNVSPLKYMWKDFKLTKPYYKIKNNTSKTLILYKVEKSKHISQDFAIMEKKLRESENDIVKLTTTAKFYQTIKKIVLKPNEKFKLYLDRLPLYRMNDDGFLVSVFGIKIYGKAIFYELKEESIEETEVIEEEEVEEIKEEDEVVEEKQKTDYEIDMNKIGNNLDEINNLIKNISKKKN